MDKLSNEILFKIFLNLNIIETKNLSLVSKKFNSIFNYLHKKNNCINVNFSNKNKILDFIQLGYRYMIFNNNISKIINIKTSDNCYKIYTYDGYIIYIHPVDIRCHNLKNKLYTNNIKLIINSKFNINSKQIVIKQMTRY
jgi:hypothetical protein